MGATFISKTGGAAVAGTIVLWYGNKADIPTGWTYYSAAAGYWVKGASSASTVPQNTTDHTHDYSNKTGLVADHNHSFSLTVGNPINATTPGYYTGATKTHEWAVNPHTHPAVHGVAFGVSTKGGHDHSLLTTGGGSPKPSSVGLFYIKRTS